MSDTAVYLLPGMKAKIKMPRFYKGQGSRKIERGDGTTESVSLQNGFAVEYPEVGDITPVTDELAVIYYHKKYSQNKVFFYGINPGEYCEISIISVPIHDHSSIVTGGPAYATFFTDSETLVSD